MKSSYSIYKKIGLILGPVLFLLLYNLPISLVNPEADRVIAIAVWMIIWWITEAVSISVTALIPLTFFPLLGIADIKTVAASYGSPIIFLFFGGFVMALALEKVNLHKRIALHIVKQTGSSPDRIILGFMLATAFLSMWISNTATTVVMLPIALSVIHLLINDEDGFTGKDRNFSICMILGIAYAANVGGIATIIGTPPNTVAVGFMQNEYGISISFLSWMLFGVPFSAIMIGIIYLVLVKLVYADKTTEIENSGQIIKSELAALGPLAGPEKRVLIIFIITVLLWILRIQINKLLPELSLTDTGISLLAAFAFFSLPYQFKTGTFTLKWEDTTRLPWGILILFGGGLALASGLSGAGVIDYIGSIVAENKALSVFLITSMLIAVMLFMTELMSNVALVAIFSPVIAGIAIGLNAPITHMLIPIAMASSCAFMLPMATPPNAIVFSSGYLKVGDMARAGLILNIISVGLLMLFSLWIIPNLS